MEESSFVVVGGGIAGVTCAENLAFLNSSKKITLITQSRLIKTVVNIIPVSKMLTSFNVEEKDANSLVTHYPNIEIIYDTLVEIQSSEKVIITESGTTLKYEYLCLCMGGKPKLIETSDYILGIRDTDSVKTLEQRLKTSKKVLIVGNGGIASELVHELDHVEIIWSVKDHHISATFVDPGAAEFFQKKLYNTEMEKSNTVVKRVRYSEGGDELRSGAALGPDWHTHYNISGVDSVKKNVTIEYGSEVRKVVYDATCNPPVKVTLSNDMEVSVDLIISATGVVPNTTIKIDKELKRSPEDGGILIDENMMTSIPYIYAAGDVCTANWSLAKHWFQMRLWTQARQMGAYAAKSITADYNQTVVLQDFCFELFAHATSLFGLKVALLGLYNGQKLNGKYECLLRMTPGEEYIKLVIVDGRIQGAILIGDTNLEETIENLILNQLDVTPYGEDLLNPDIDIEDYFD